MFVGLVLESEIRARPFNWPQITKNILDIVVRGIRMLFWLFLGLVFNLKILIFPGPG